jgi:hypothetical protein
MLLRMIASRFIGLFDRVALPPPVGEKVVVDLAKRTLRHELTRRRPW